MAIQGPWYISAAAVRDYLRIRGWPVQDDGERFDRGELDLREQARAIVAAGKPGRELPSGLYQFRGGRPLRLRLIVSYGKRPEGDLPQLIAVKPDSEARAGAYSRSDSPDRRGGKGHHGRKS